MNEPPTDEQLHGRVSQQRCYAVHVALLAAVVVGAVDGHVAGHFAQALLGAFGAALLGVASIGVQTIVLHHEQNVETNAHDGEAEFDRILICDGGSQRRRRHSAHANVQNGSRLPWLSESGATTLL